MRAMEAFAPVHSADATHFMKLAQQQIPMGAMNVVFLQPEIHADTMLLTRRHLEHVETTATQP